MPGPLDNPRHEKFAQALFQGKSAAEAYRSVGYAANEGNAIRLKGHEQVQARLRELQLQTAERAVVSMESLVRELEEARMLAIHLEQPAAAVQAIIGKARITGKIIDRKEIGEPGDFDRLTDDELVQEIRRESEAIALLGHSKGTVN